MEVSDPRTPIFGCCYGHQVLQCTEKFRPCQHAEKITTSAEKYKPAAFISIELLKNALPLPKMIAAAYRNIIP
jgi:hypothetical protein